MSNPAADEHARSEPHVADDDWHRPWLGLCIVAVVAAAILIGFLDLPRERAWLPDIARHAMEIAQPNWGTPEAVNEVVYGSRGFDTFGETFLLLAAVISVVVLSRPREPRTEYVGESSAGQKEQREFDPPGHTDREEQQARQAEEREETAQDEPLPDADEVPLGGRAPERAEAMTVVVRIAARAAAVILAVAGVYLAAWGYTPGGGFPAGAALAGVAILVYTALGRRAVEKVVKQTILEPIEIAGALAIILIGVLGLAYHGSLFANWIHLAAYQQIRSGGTTQPYSGSELIEVATGLIIAIFALLGMEHDWAPDEDEDETDDGGGGQ
jgi:multicomponent Na+:H+ antiporter subunit B